MTSTPDYLPLIACAPWCAFGDGHSMCVFAKGQVCWSEPLQIPLSLQPLISTGAQDPATGAWGPGPDSMDVCAGRDANGALCVNLEPTDAVPIKVSIDEARQLVEALQLVLGVVSA